MLIGSAKEWLKQRSNKTQYTVGETAIIYCSLLEQSDVEGYEVTWIVEFDPKNKQDLTDVDIYKHAEIESNATYSKLTLTNLTMNHIDKLICKATFWVNKRMIQRLGNGTTLQIVHSVQSTTSQTEGMSKHNTICVKYFEGIFI